MRGLLSFTLLLLCVDQLDAKTIRHYVFFNIDRAAVRDPAFLRDPAFAGAQIKYTWPQLEPAKDRYDFTPIREDLALLSEHGKKLFIQLQDVSFHESIVNVPQYLREEKEYGGGAHRDVVDEGRGIRGGWVARRWDPEVRRRFHKLLAALGRDFDGRIEGITLPETAIGFGETGKLYPAGYSPAVYRQGILENMTALKRAFPRSVAMIYANFMPGEWLPWKDKGYLRSVAAHARDIGVALGGPDLLPHRRGQLNHGYKLIREAAGIVPTGIAVQEGNYGEKNPNTGARNTVAELFAFARDHLNVDYLFWFREEPYFTRDVLPFLKLQRDQAPLASRR